MSVTNGGTAKPFQQVWQIIGIGGTGSIVIVFFGKTPSSSRHHVKIAPYRGVGICDTTDRIGLGGITGRISSAIWFVRKSIVWIILARARSKWMEWPYLLPQPAGDAIPNCGGRPIRTDHVARGSSTRNHSVCPVYHDPFRTGHDLKRFRNP
jgi:hypothetical protein